MPVVQVSEGIEVLPDVVYVIPPGSDLALRDGHLTLLKPEQQHGFRLPIDFFFRSLAQDQGENAIAIVLSGTGSDGSQGMKNIKAEGGLTIAQNPDTAEYGDMPRNAIATKEVDYILPPAKMGELILKYIHHQVIEGYKQSERELQIPASGLQRLYFLLRAKTGHDFSLYKQNTLLRRIERRMKITLVKDLDEYIDFLEAHPEEIGALFQEMLINVTHFFRDPDAFEALTEKAIRPLIAIKCAENMPLRIWVAGCSSGEEAYSIAIAIQEEIDALKAKCKVLIYATDLDLDAIEVARKGFYSDGSLENVSTERLQRFFIQEDEGYQIKKNIRDLVVFSTQNLLSDPPFSKIDLLCCRNVLIYLEHELQNQLFLQFHYSLNPNGVLFLGTSESISGNSDLFAVMDRKHKLFQRKEAVTQRLMKTRPRMAFTAATGRTQRSGVDRPSNGGLREWTEKALLEFHTPACVVVDKKHNILFIHGRTGKYLEPVAGDPSNNLVRMAREGLKTELATAIHAVISHQVTVRREGVRVKTNGDYETINLTVRPFEGPSDDGELILVVFEEVHSFPAEPVSMVQMDTDKNHRVVQLEKELKEKDDYLHTIIDELEDANQDLKSTNEELQSSNEELQSTNEELETSKEELQSINEELSTINAELQNKNEELSGVNNDIYNLLSSIEIGIIFLDLDLHIRRFTPAIHRIYNLLSTDIGRPINHFVSSLDYDYLVKDIQQVLKTLIPKAIEVQAKDGVWYLIHIRPYRTIENVIDGTVITFVDISEQKRGDELRRMGTILRDSNDAITVQDFDGKILAWNRGAAQMYGWTEAEALTMNSQDIIPKNKRAETLELYHRLENGENIRSFETQRVTRDGQILDVWVTLTALVDNANCPTGIATTERDITHRNQASHDLFFENRALKALYGWQQAASEHPESRSLAKTACRILIDAGYSLAWIGAQEKDNPKAIMPVAWEGLDNRNSSSLIVSTQEPIERALTRGEPVVVHSAGDGLPMACFPLIHKNTPWGALIVFASERDAFPDLEVMYLAVFSKRITEVIRQAGVD
jgi:two-component system CheB/CheR fusion protein